MGLLARFTRDSASKFVWGSLLLAAILGLVFTLTSGGEAIRQERQAAERRSVAHVEDVLMPRLEGMDLRSPIAGQDLAALREALDRSIMADPRVARVRIWSPDGVLLFSTDRGEEPGSNAALNDDLLQRVSDGTTLTRWNLSDVGGLDEEGRSLLRTYAPLRAGTVAEVDHTEVGTVGPVATSWLGYQILAGVFVAFFLGMTILSLREPLDRINVGVPFAPTNVPVGYALIDDERLHAVEEVYRLAHERVAKLEQRLAESEEVRRALEGDLQRALTMAATGAVTAPASAPVSDVRPAEPEPAPVVQQAPSRRSTLIERAVQPAAKPAAAPAAPPTPTKKERRANRPVKRAAERPAAPKEPRRPAAGVAPDPAPAPALARAEPPLAAPDVVTVPDSDVLGDSWTAAPAASAGALARATRETRTASQPEGPRPAPAAASPEKPKRQRLKRRAEPVAAPAAPTSAAETDVAEAKAHAAALETFIRLTESDRQHHDAESGDVDQGAVRAALARTAARKKPGGTKLQAREEPRQEVQGGGPSRDDR